VRANPRPNARTCLAEGSAHAGLSATGKLGTHSKRRQHSPNLEQNSRRSAGRLAVRAPGAAMTIRIRRETNRYMPTVEEEIAEVQAPDADSLMNFSFASFYGRILVRRACLRIRPEIYRHRERSKAQVERLFGNWGSRRAAFARVAAARWSRRSRPPFPLKLPTRGPTPFLIGQTAFRPERTSHPRLPRR